MLLGEEDNVLSMMNRPIERLHGLTCVKAEHPPITRLLLCDSNTVSSNVCILPRYDSVRAMQF